MKILKFGGTSVGSPEALGNVLSIIEREAKNGSETVAVVVSAFSKVTDSLRDTAYKAASGDKGYCIAFDELSARHFDTVKRLIPLIDHPRILACVKETLNELEDALLGILLLKEVSDQALDIVMSFGERLSAYIISEALSSRGVAALFCDARKVIVTDNHFGSAQVLMPQTGERIAEWFSSAQGVSIITGFLGSTLEGVTTTLGRGGSDYTAAILGASTGASVIEIWTDVDGVMTADPRTCVSARLVPQLSYIEALELSHFGAKVIYPPTILPALEKQIPLLIKNTFNPLASGTLINGKTHIWDSAIKGISSISSIALLHIEGIGLIGAIGAASRIFSALARASVNVILITQASSEYSICIGVARLDATRAQTVIDEEFALERTAARMKPTHIEYDRTIITIVGEGMRKTPRIAGRLFSTLGKEKINTIAISQGSSELSISTVIESKDEIRALRAIHAEFFESQNCQPTIFLVGTGLIGDKLLSILQTNPVARIGGIANTQHMIVDERGVDRAALAKKGEPHSLEKFIDQICISRTPNRVFVDCSASDTLPAHYPLLLSKGVSVVTPNKKGLSGDLASYQRLKEIAQHAAASFFYETTVGAALPVIATLTDLLKTGDRILSIQAVLSGTLSYIFNTFCSGEKAFSQIVREAKEKGYTEPDPRDDLSGLDVARKILILARECGSPLELTDVHIQPVLPKECFDADGVDAFFQTLAYLDSAMDTKRKQAKQNEKVFRYIASLQDGKASIELMAVATSNPFATLSGSDNMIVFTTDRYCDTPLVVRGPGAGAAVTAAGVLADILKTIR